MQLYSSWIESPLGPLFVAANEQSVYLLEFSSPNRLETTLDRFKKITDTTIAPGTTKPLHNIQKELQAYFKGKLQTFKTPLSVIGTPFQKKVWKALQQIPIGTTVSYLDLAKAIGKPLAVRAVANANASNRLSIIIPCHRVIQHNGMIGGYGGGVSRKEWLLSHERSIL